MKASDSAVITRTLWLDDSQAFIHIIDQTQLPYRLQTLTLKTLEDVCHAIVSMQVRGAPLIGITAAYGFAFALQEKKLAPENIARQLLATRPTAVNLHWA